MNIEMAERKHMGGVSLMWCEKKVQKLRAIFVRFRGSQLLTTSFKSQSCGFGLVRKHPHLTALLTRSYRILLNRQR